MKIGFTGPFGDANFGDYAMLVNNIYDIGIKNLKIFTYNEELLELLNKDYKVVIYFVILISICDSQHNLFLDHHFHLKQKNKS